MLSPVNPNGIRTTPVNHYESLRSIIPFRDILNFIMEIRKYKTIHYIENIS